MNEENVKGRGRGGSGGPKDARERKNIKKVALKKSKGGEGAEGGGGDSDAKKGTFHFRSEVDRYLKSQMKE